MQRSMGCESGIRAVFGYGTPMWLFGTPGSRIRSTQAGCAAPGSPPTTPASPWRWRYAAPISRPARRNRYPFRPRPRTAGLVPRQQYVRVRRGERAVIQSSGERRTACSLRSSIVAWVVFPEPGRPHTIISLARLAEPSIGNQWRKWRIPVKTMATPTLSAAAITSSSRTEPPG